MDARTLLSNLESLGIHLWADGDILRVDGPKELTLSEVHRNAIRALKPQLLALLQSERFAPEPELTARIRSVRSMPEATTTDLTHALPIVQTNKPDKLETARSVITTLQDRRLVPKPNAEGREALSVFWPLIRAAHAERLEELTVLFWNETMPIGEIVRRLSAAIFYGYDREQWPGWLENLSRLNVWYEQTFRTEADFVLPLIQQEVGCS